MKTSKTFSIHFWLKKTAKCKNTQIPIYARITVDGARADVSIKRTVKEEHWCTESRKLNPRISIAKNINRYLDDVYAKILDCHKQLHSENGLITAQAIKLRYLGKDKEVSTLKELIGYHQNYELAKLEPGTAKNYSATEKYLSRFIIKKFKISDIQLALVDYTFIVEFEYYLRNCPPLCKSQPIKNNGIMKHMQRFKKMVNIANKFGWIKQNPFALYQFKFEEYDSDFLEAHEIEAIKCLEISESGIQLVRDVFIFSCYTGLSYIEVKLLKQTDIVKGIDGEDWVNVRRKKTNTPVKVPLLKEAKVILEQYSYYLNIDNEQRLLPVYANQKVNEYLKIIAKRVGLHKHLTFHVARHTFATTITLLNDVPLETVSKLLGHTKLSTTQKYARVVEKKISKDMTQLKAKLKMNSRKNLDNKATAYNHLRIV